MHLTSHVRSSVLFLARLHDVPANPKFTEGQPCQRINHCYGFSVITIRRKDILGKHCKKNCFKTLEMSAKRKCWTPVEEDRFLRVWYTNLGALHSGKKRSEVYRDLEVEFTNQGIDVSAGHIKAKMESFKRKYHHIINENRSKKKWKHFKTLAAIMEYQDESKEIEFETQLEDSSSGTFSSVFVDEIGSLLFNEEECSQNENIVKPQPKKTRQAANKSDSANSSDSTQKNATQEKPKRRKCWSLHEEEIFLGVWKTFVRDLRSDIKKSVVYMSMEIELHHQGIEIKPADIKTKIESLTRKFRKLRDSEDLKTEWIHYSKVSELLGTLEATKFDEYSEHSETSSYAEDSSSWFNDNKAMYPDTCIKLENSYHDNESGVENVTSVNKETTNEIAIKDIESDVHTDDVLDKSNSLGQFLSKNQLLQPEYLEFDMQCDDSMEQPNVKQQSSNTSQISCKTQLTEQFGQFVTKELNMLSDDLLIEAKRRIYDIICCMQMKQLNKSNKITD